mmetsp:Transcript_3451/g.7602  ORF Transcript_3451/g.7602 Transcript_3451/m.7602 type:complete len:347 (-) Transcript_3451:213-1253(-)
MISNSSLSVNKLAIVRPLHWVTMCCVFGCFSLLAGREPLLAKAKAKTKTNGNSAWQEPAWQEPNRLEWNWHHFHESRNNTRRLLIVQYTGWDDYYFKMTDKTEKPNREYAKRRHVDYVRLNGNAYGASYGSYNKIYALDTVKSSHDNYDAVLLLDSDCIIVDWEFDALDLLPEKNLLTAQMVRKKDPTYTFDINNGITLWNMRHPEFDFVLSKWKEIAMGDVSNNLPPSDQRGLHKVLRMYSDEDRRDRGVVNAIEGNAKTPGPFTYLAGTFVKHYINAAYVQESGIGTKFQPNEQRLKEITEMAHQVYQKSGREIVRTTHMPISPTRNNKNIPGNTSSVRLQTET